MILCELYSILVKKYIDVIVKKILNEITYFKNLISTLFEGKNFVIK